MNSTSRLPSSLLLVGLVAGCIAGDSPWRPADGRLTTPWTDEVSPSNALPEYPRPLMVRASWLNLNGLWDYAIRAVDASAPSTYDGHILVPFPVESALSGVMKRVGDQERLWYRRSLKIPRDWAGQRVLLHFGAVDFHAIVWLNDRYVGEHRGGYDGFSFDITEALGDRRSGELVLAVWDPTDAGPYARGKQVSKPHGIWYTPTTGIWRTAWLEPVPQDHIRSLKITPHYDRSAVEVEVTAIASDDPTISVEVLDGSVVVSSGSITTGTLESDGTPATVRPRITLRVPEARGWSPSSPFLYGLRITLAREGGIVDRVDSYFGLRKISLGIDEHGFTRLYLNNKPLFQLGPLDQGFWPDGLYTAPTDAALRHDVEITKGLGMNMARKHVKIEPARWYYWCDRLGLLVWQDMPSGRNDTPESREQFEAELKALIDGRHNHPSIVMWVPFNEGWGQYDTERIAAWIKAYDPTRLVNNASGWTDKAVGDVHDIHSYPGPAAPDPERERAGVLGEFGGLGLPVRGHTWQAEKNWGYRSYENSADLTSAYVLLLKKLHPLIGTHGLAAAVYTQTSDVEIEVNGLMTYDRAQIKLDADAIAKANLKIHEPPPPPPIVEPLAPTSRKEGVPWRYTFAKPAEDWFAVDFDDRAWTRGPGGFGTKGTPNAIVRTEWKSDRIWLRRTFELPADFPREHLHLILHHDEDAELYLNGAKVASYPGYTTGYELFPAGKKLLEALRPGRNILAVHCRQTGGGQYIDVGIADVRERN